MALKRDADKPMLPAKPVERFEKYQPTAEDRAAGRVAIERMRRICSFRTAPDRRAWARKILERHAKGEHVAPIALQSAREAIAKDAHAEEMRKTEEELSLRPVVPSGD